MKTFFLVFRESYFLAATARLFLSNLVPEDDPAFEGAPPLAVLTLAVAFAFHEFSARFEVGEDALLYGVNVVSKTLRSLYSPCPAPLSSSILTVCNLVIPSSSSS